MHEGDSHLDPFSMEELQKAMEHLKLGKAAGLDGISTEVVNILDLKPNNGYLTYLTYVQHHVKSLKLGERLKL